MCGENFISQSDKKRKKQNKIIKEEGKSEMMSWEAGDLWEKGGAQTAKVFLDKGPKSLPQSSNPAVLATSWLNV